ncbi:methyltransferase family protein [Candidatus Lucifugimonas marina]|uniref:methyltransferase family protein n=1 Tax=Candidatus Lucifugimonas marina TaxID=3038979 RepID=UPI00319E5252
MGWLRNLPIPEYQLGFLLAGLGLHLWGESRAVFDVGIIGVALGVVLIGIGIVVSIMSALSFGDETMASPDTLRTSGPYRFTRNPMYLSWLLATLGLGLFLGSWWLIAASGAAGAVTQLLVISAEEQFLTHKFGSRYENYRNQTPRWIWPL